MSRAASILKFAGPFLVGLIAGSLLLLTAEQWLPEIENVAIALVIAAGSLLAVLIVVWAIYRIAVARLAATGGTAKRTAALLMRRPHLVMQKRFREKHLAPALGQVFPTVAAWVSFTASFGIITLVLTNILLFATLIVQLLSADRLAAQNNLLTKQNEFLRVQARVDVTTLMQEQQATVQEYARHWDILSAFRITGFGHPLEDVVLLPECPAMEGCGTPVADMIEVFSSSQPPVITIPDAGRHAITRLQAGHSALRQRIIDYGVIPADEAAGASVEVLLHFIRAASQACNGKDEYTVTVIADYRRFLNLLAAAEQTGDAVGLLGAMRAFDRDLAEDPARSWQAFSADFGNRLDVLQQDLAGVTEYCQFANEEGWDLITELETFLEDTKPPADPDAEN